MAATLSYSTQIFKRESFEQAVAWVARLGMSAVEVGREHAEEMFNSDEVLAAARDVADAHGVRLASLHAWGQLPDGCLGDVCHTTDRLGGGLIVIHASHQYLTEQMDAAKAELSEWDAWCRDRNIILTVENSSRQPLETFCRLFDAVPTLRMTLDVKHAYKPQKLGLTHVDYMRELGDRVANFHVLGIDPERDDPLGDGLPAGREPADFSYPDLSADLIARGYAGIITIETSINYTEPMDYLLKAYAEVAAESPGELLPCRLSRHNANFFANVFAGAIEPLRPAGG